MKLNAKLLLYPIVVAVISGVLIAIPTTLLGVPAFLVFAALGSGGAIGGYVASGGVLLTGIFLLWVAGFIIIKVSAFFDADRNTKA